MKNSQAKSILTTMYGKRCLLTGYKMPKDKLTYHHIVKREWGGTSTPENGANLMQEIHNWLHCSIEQNNKELFLLINECLMLYKKVLDKNNIDLIRQFEEECQPLFREECRKCGSQKMYRKTKGRN